VTGWLERLPPLLEAHRGTEVREALEAFKGLLEARDLAQRMRGRPRWTHDCTGCDFKGSVGQFDVYECFTVPPAVNLVRSSSLIARYGSAGPEYASAPRHVFAGIVHDTILGKVTDDKAVIVWTLPDWMNAILRVVCQEPEE